MNAVNIYEEIIGFGGDGKIIKTNSDNISSTLKPKLYLTIAIWTTQQAVANIKVQHITN